MYLFTEFLVAVNLCGVLCTNGFRDWFTVCKQKRLTNGITVLKEFPVATKEECTLACRDDDDCLSINVIRQSLGYTCQMMSNTPVECDSLQDDMTSVYIKLDAQQCVHGGKWNFITQNCGTCNPGYAGAYCERHILDCAEGYANGQRGIADVLLQPANWIAPFPAKCSFDYRFTYIARRTTCDNLGNFNQNWLTYKEGFGSLGCSFFLGLEKIHLLTQLGRTKLKLQADGIRRYSSFYYNFRLDNESGKYAMHYDSYASSADKAGDGFSMGAPTASVNHAPFCTPDNDCNSCAQTSSSGWWFNTNCAYINLHVPYGSGQLKWPRTSTDNTTESLDEFAIFVYPE